MKPLLIVFIMWLEYLKVYLQKNNALDRQETTDISSQSHVLLLKPLFRCVCLPRKWSLRLVSQSSCIISIWAGTKEAVSYPTNANTLRFSMGLLFLS